MTIDTLTSLAMKRLAGKDFIKRLIKNNRTELPLLQKHFLLSKNILIFNALQTYRKNLMKFIIGRIARLCEPSIFLTKIQKKVRAIIANADIIHYGSHARGQAGKESDWNLLILVDQLIDNNLKTDLIVSLYDLEVETDEVISSIVRSSEEWNSPNYAILPFNKKVETEGIFL
jgi:predicted nucleotidyltransferase